MRFEQFQRYGMSAGPGRWLTAIIVSVLGVIVCVLVALYNGLFEQPASLALKIVGGSALGSALAATFLAAPPWRVMVPAITLASSISGSVVLWKLADAAAVMGYLATSAQLRASLWWMAPLMLVGCAACTGLVCWMREMLE